MNNVYVKSKLAANEFVHGNRSLSLKHRQILILVNGRRTAGNIAQMINSDSAVSMLIDLERLGYVFNANSTQKTPQMQASRSKQDDTLSQDHLVYIKNFMVEEAQLQLGLMSRNIEQKVALVKNTDDLKACISRWHMAIRDSRNGRTVADKLMERLAHLMANPPQGNISETAS